MLSDGIGKYLVFFFMNLFKVCPSVRQNSRNIKAEDGGEDISVPPCKVCHAIRAILCPSLFFLTRGIFHLNILLPAELNLPDWFIIALLEMGSYKKRLL